MKILSGNTEYFALDIGATAVRVIQLTHTGSAWSLSHYGMAPIDLRLSTSDSPNDQKKLGETIMAVVGQSGIATRNVVLGAPSNKTFATVIELPDMPSNELAATIKYQADQYIPTSLDESTVDWALLGKPFKDSVKNEVLLASVANKFVETRLDLVENLGFEVVAIEPDSLALVRSLQPTGVAEGRVIVEFGDFSTDIILTYNNAPRLVRTIPTGAQSLVKSAVQNLNVSFEQAQQFVSKFGMQPDKLEGQVVRAIEGNVEVVVSEIAKSIKFFQTKYPSIPVGGMIMSNYAVTIPGFSQYMTDKLGLPVQAGNPWQQVRVASGDQATLQPLSSQFGVAIGLAQRGSV